MVRTAFDPLPVRSRLRSLYWINLDRRSDRRVAQEEELRRHGLTDLSERISAMDGRTLNLRTLQQTYGPNVIAPTGIDQANNAPDFVLGRVLTPGAIGLWLTWHEILHRIVREAGEGDCYLIAEDDATYASGVRESLSAALDALDAQDPRWEAMSVGYLASKSTVIPLNSGVGLPFKLVGNSGLVVRGVDGAKALLAALFPVHAEEQLDRKLSDIMLQRIYSMKNGNTSDEGLRLYAVTSPLAEAPMSEEGDTDIQKIPESKASELKLDAQLRKAAVQAGKIGIGASSSPEENTRRQQVISQLLAVMKSSQQELGTVLPRSVAAAEEPRRPKSKGGAFGRWAEGRAAGAMPAK